MLTASANHRYLLSNQTLVHLPKFPLSKEQHSVGERRSAACLILRCDCSMAVRGVDFKWYDGFFLSMLATSVIIVAINWGKYDLCTYPLHIWIVVDYSIVFVFRLLMFVDNGLSAGMGLDFGSQQRYARFCGRVLVLSILAFILYPFLWTWNVIGIRWFSRGQDCLPVQGQKWGFLIWLLFSYCGLICIAGLCIRKWLARRQALAQRAQQGLPISEIGVLLDMIRVPDWAFEAAGQELQLMGQDAGYHPGLYLTPTQREAVEVLIQDLPKFRLKAVPADCCECPICLEEFQMGDEVRGLPCAHNFHVACIDEWLRLNVKCPRCRSSVFPNLDLRAISNLPPDSSALSAPSVVTTIQHARYQTASQSHFRFPGLLIPIRSGNAGLRVAANSLTVDLESRHISVPIQHNSIHNC